MFYKLSFLTHLNYHESSSLACGWTFGSSDKHFFLLHIKAKANFGLSAYVEYRIFVIWLVQRINVHLHTIIYTSQSF